MPTYVFQNKKTKRRTDEVFCTISEMEQRLKDNPNEELAPSAPAIVSGVRSRRTKAPDSFRDILRSVKKRNPGSTIDPD